MPDIAALDARFAHLADEYERRKAAAHERVVEWAWYSWEAFDARPLTYERDLLRPGRRLDERPPSSMDHHRAGFDAAGQPAVVLQYSGSLDGTLYYETFREPPTAEGVVEEAYFHADGRPIYLHEYRYEDGLIRSAAIAASGGGGYESYEYTGDRVTRIEVYDARPTGKPEPRLQPMRPHSTINATYDDAGLTRLEIVSGRYTEVKYERPPADFTIDGACEVVGRELVTQIPLAVGALDISERAYCVVLAYLDSLVEPIVYVGLDGERDDEDCWAPGEMDNDAYADLTAVADTARLLAQELSLLNAEDINEPSRRGSERGRVLLCGVASALNSHDWEAVLPVTEDFIVYAVDMEMVDFERNLPECVPAARLTTLRERGLL